MKEQNSSEISIDEPTTRAMMSHYKINDHDEFVRYARHLGIEHND